MRCLIAETEEGEYYIVDEWYWDHAKQGELNDPQQAQAAIDQFSYVPIDVWICDRNSTGLIYQLQCKTSDKVYAQTENVEDGLEKMGTLLYTKKLFFTKNVPFVVKQMRNYKYKFRADGIRVDKTKPIQEEQSWD